MEQKITKISYANDITLITISSLPSVRAVSQVLTAFAQHGINVDMISQTAPQGGSVRLSFTVSDRDLGDVLTILGQLSGKHQNLSPEILPGNSKIAFYDADMVNTPGVAAKVFSLLSDANIQIMLITTSDVDISILVSSHDLGDALHTMRDGFQVEPVEAQF